MQKNTLKEECEQIYVNIIKSLPKIIVWSDDRWPLLRLEIDPFFPNYKKWMLEKGPDMSQN